MVVARVGVAALAVGQAVADRMVIVALDALYAPVDEEWKDPIGMGPEGAEIAQAVASLDVSAPSVVQGGGEGQVIAVDAANDGDAR